MAAYNLTANDIYTDDTNPKKNSNPKRRGAIWVNNATGEAFTCVDNTANSNVWVGVNPDLWYDFGEVSGTFSLNFKQYDNYNNFRVTLTGDTRFTSVIAAGARERSGLLMVYGNPWDRMKSFFSNVYYSFEFKFDEKPKGVGSDGNLFIFPYKITNRSEIIFTRC